MLRADTEFPRAEDYAARLGSQFQWGVSSSAYQTEGAHLADGKGPSIWDDFVRRRGVIRDASNADHACDFYHRYAADLRLLKELGIKNFRFSISWPRVLPTGVGTPNPKGLAFYHNLIEQALALEIKPWVTLYHWDLPLELEKKGGWANRDVIHWFEAYADLCARQFGDRVNHWIVLNEPLVFTGAGYFFGVHAPGRKSMNDFLAAVHHASLCQAAGARVLKSRHPNAHVGTSISCAHVSPQSDRPADVSAAKRVDALLNRMFVEPFLGLGYPLDDLKGMRIIEKFMLPGDESRMQFDFDFLGIQSYTREVVKHSLFTPVVRAKIIPAHQRNSPLTAINWEIYPEGLYHLLMKFSAYPGLRSLVITENGAAFHDKPQGRIVNDIRRMEYLDDHLMQVARAREDGAKVDGYFVWTLLDNFEWAEGYAPRFGLIYVDFQSQERYIKQSALWYAQVAGNQVYQLAKLR